MFDFKKKNAKPEEPELSGDVKEGTGEASSAGKKEAGYFYSDEDLAVPEIHIRKYEKDMEFLEEILEEDEEEEEEPIETENLAFPEIHLRRKKKKQ